MRGRRYRHRRGGGRGGGGGGGDSGGNRSGAHHRTNNVRNAAASTRNDGSAKTKGDRPLLLKPFRSASRNMKNLARVIGNDDENNSASGAEESGAEMDAQSPGSPATSPPPPVFHQDDRDVTEDDDAMPEHDPDAIILDVECGLNKATLYLKKMCSGSKGICVLFDCAWMTPNEFQYISGRETAKDWKRSIKHFGKSLKLLIAKGLLTTKPPQCKCEGCDGTEVDPVGNTVSNPKRQYIHRRPPHTPTNGMLVNQRGGATYRPGFVMSKRPADALDAPPASRQPKQDAERTDSPTHGVDAGVDGERARPLLHSAQNGDGSGDETDDSQQTIIGSPYQNEAPQSPGSPQEARDHLQGLNAAAEETSSDGVDPEPTTHRASPTEDRHIDQSVVVDVVAPVQNTPGVSPGSASEEEAKARRQPTTPEESESGPGEDIGQGTAIEQDHSDRDREGLQAGMRRKTPDMVEEKSEPPPCSDEYERRKRAELKEETLVGCGHDDRIGPEETCVGIERHDPIKATYNVQQALLPPDAGEGIVTAACINDSHLEQRDTNGVGIQQETAPPDNIASRSAAVIAVEQVTMDEPRNGVVEIEKEKEDNHHHDDKKKDDLVSHPKSSSHEDLSKASSPSPAGVEMDRPRNDELTAMAKVLDDDLVARPCTNEVTTLVTIEKGLKNEGNGGGDNSAIAELKQGSATTISSHKDASLETQSKRDVVNHVNVNVGGRIVDPGSQDRTEASAMDNASPNSNTTRYRPRADTVSESESELLVAETSKKTETDGAVAVVDIRANNSPPLQITPVVAPAPEVRDVRPSGSISGQPADVVVRVDPSTGGYPSGNIKAKDKNSAPICGSKKKRYLPDSSKDAPIRLPKKRILEKALQDELDDLRKPNIDNNNQMIVNRMYPGAVVHLSEQQQQSGLVKPEFMSVSRDSPVTRVESLSTSAVLTSSYPPVKDLTPRNVQAKKPEAHMPVKQDIKSWPLARGHSPEGAAIMAAHHESFGRSLLFPGMQFPVLSSESSSPLQAKRASVYVKGVSTAAPASFPYQPHMRSAPVPLPSSSQVCDARKMEDRRIQEIRHEADSGDLSPRKEKRLTNIIAELKSYKKQLIHRIEEQTDSDLECQVDGQTDAAASAAAAAAAAVAASNVVLPAGKVVEPPLSHPALHKEGMKRSEGRRESSVKLPSPTAAVPYVGLPPAGGMAFPPYTMSLPFPIPYYMPHGFLYHPLLNSGGHVTLPPSATVAAVPSANGLEANKHGHEATNRKSASPKASVVPKKRSQTKKSRNNSPHTESKSPHSIPAYPQPTPPSYKYVNGDGNATTIDFNHSAKTMSYPGSSVLKTMLTSSDIPQSAPSMYSPEMTSNYMIQSASSSHSSLTLAPSVATSRGEGSPFAPELTFDQTGALDLSTNKRKCSHFDEYSARQKKCIVENRPGTNGSNVLDLRKAIVRV